MSQVIGGIIRDRFTVSECGVPDRDLVPFLLSDKRIRAAARYLILEFKLPPISFASENIPIQLRKDHQKYLAL